jgi:TfoX/Sxy family transcriptional regulator of competence genes
MAYDENLAGRIRIILAERQYIDEKKMFGGLAFLLNDYMFVGVNDDRLMARVGPEQYETALERPHARMMDFTGRPLTGYVYVDTPGIERDSDLKAWVELCADFVMTLPPKVK